MIWLVVVGIAGGVISGILGVGGGVVFVPGLVLITNLHQVDANATSLLAIVPTALVGGWRQYRYGNVRLGDGIGLGALAAAGAVGGVALANVLPGRVLQVGFALVMLLTAGQLVRRAMAPPQTPGEDHPTR